MKEQKKQPWQLYNEIDGVIIKTIGQHMSQLRQQRYGPLQQLNLKQNLNDFQQLKIILGQFLCYPSIEVAQLHKRANVLGNLNQMTFQQQSNKNIRKCYCCGKYQMESRLPYCTSFTQISDLGVSTALYFMTIKNLIYLLLISFFVFCIYALTTNVISAQNYKSMVNPDEVINSKKSYEGFLMLSLGSKQINSTLQNTYYIFIQGWIGVTMLIVWMIMIIFIRVNQGNLIFQYDKKQISISDYTILIRNFPFNMTKQQLQTELNKYIKQAEVQNQVLKQYKKQQIKVIKISKQIPYQDINQYQNPTLKQNIQNKSNQYKRLKKQFIQYIIFRMKQQRPLQSYQKKIINDKIDYFRKLKIQYNQYLQIYSQQIYKKSLNQYKYDVVPTFVTLACNYNKYFLILTNENMFKTHPCTNSPNFSLQVSRPFKFSFFYQNKKYEQIARIQEAPEPEDIEWRNLSPKSSYYLKQRLFTILITVILPGISFAFNYLAQNIQAIFYNEGFFGTIISIFISLIVLLFNLLTEKFINFLTKFQRHPTISQAQTSMCIKSIIADLFNCIAIPIMVNYLLKKNLYGVYGLAHNIFYLALTNAFVYPSLFLINFNYYFCLIKKWFYRNPIARLGIIQQDLNKIFQNPEFQVGFQYIYIVNTFLFTCFFISLQPIIVVFAFFGLIYLNLTAKYSLFYLCKNPRRGNSDLNSAVYHLIQFGPAFFTLGNFCWFHFTKNEYSGITSNAVSAAISLLIVIMPYNMISKKILVKDMKKWTKNYYQNAIKLIPFEYDNQFPIIRTKKQKQLYRRVIQNFCDGIRSKKNLQLIKNQLLGRIYTQQIQRYILESDIGRVINYPIIKPGIYVIPCLNWDYEQQISHQIPYSSQRNQILGSPYSTKDQNVSFPTFPAQRVVRVPAQRNELQSYKSLTNRYIRKVIQVDKNGFK